MTSQTKVTPEDLQTGGASHAQVNSAFRFTASDKQTQRTSPNTSISSDTSQATWKGCETQNGLYPENQELDLYRSPPETETHQVPAADDLQTSSSDSNNSGTKPKKATILGGDAVNRTPDAHPADTVENNQRRPSAPRDVVKVYMIVEWSKAQPDRWKNHLQKALQTWCNFELKKSTSVEKFEFIDDGHNVEVELTPSTALNDIKTATLKLKDLKDEVTVRFQKDWPTNVKCEVKLEAYGMLTSVQKMTERIKTIYIICNGKSGFGIRPNWNSTSRLERIMFEKKGSTVKDVNENTTDAEKIPDEGTRRNMFIHGATASPSPEHNEMKSEAHNDLDPLTLPPFHFWYLSQVYREEMEQIMNKFGVKISAETSVSISASKDKQNKSNSVRDAALAFSDLVQKATKNLQSVSVPQTYMESEIMKETLRILPDENNKMMMCMSPNQHLLFGPERITSVVVKRLHMEPNDGPGRSLNANPREASETRTSTQAMRKDIDMTIKDTQAPLFVAEPYKNLLEIAFNEQLLEIQNKFGVQFDADHSQGLIKVSVRSRGPPQVNLEFHALTAFTRLYQKVVTSAAMCDLTDTEHMSQILERIRSQHRCVLVLERNGGRQLFGLPKHLVPAIVDIENLAKCPVVDEKTKQSLGYPFSQASGIHAEPMRVDMMTGEHGTDGTNLNSSTEATWDSKKKENDKSKEDNCSICLDTFTKKTKLKCSHEFCKLCLDQSIESLGAICPICKEIFGTLTGDQPNGSMNVKYVPKILPGFEEFETIEITYRFSDGIQTEKHPNPGRRYHGTSRTAYLPNNPEGKHVLNLLKRAFDQKLIFTVGYSRTTGLEDAVTWNDIHHKTNIYGGPQAFGYPDPGYLTRVKEELKAKGIK